MKQYHIEVFNINTLETVDEFTTSFKNIDDLTEYMENTQLHSYNIDYYFLEWSFNEISHKNKNKNKNNNNNTPTHYQATTQPIDLINAQNLNFNLGNVVKYVSRAGKKQGESNLKDLEKARDYINYEIKRLGELKQ